MKEPEVTQAPERASIVNLLSGGIVEMVDAELQRVADNILDPNTNERTPRKVTLTISIKPDVDRSIAAVAIDVVAKLAPCRPQATRLFIGQQRGKGVLVEHDPQQQQLPLTTATTIKAAG